MGTAAELRKQIESALAGRIPAALSPRPLRSPELVSCGVAEVDSLLGGGLPLGTIAEFTGAGSSGRTTLALSTLAGLTRQGHCCAYVDACDALDPLSAAALGVELRRLLWIRTPEDRFLPPHATCGRAGDPGNTKTNKLRVPHISPLLGDVGQVAHICPSLANVGSMRSTQSNPYFRLDRALRSTDLLLNAGGWSAVVLDLGELPPAQARRVPLATWYRFRLQAEKSRALLLLLTPIACANSCAAVSLHSEETQAAWRRAALGVPAAPVGIPGKPVFGLPGRFGVLGWKSGPALLAELHHRVSVSRSRAAASIPKDSAPKKPAASHPISAKDGQMRGPEQAWWTSALVWPG